jgi:hypothetical protein
VPLVSQTTPIATSAAKAVPRTDAAIVSFLLASSESTGTAGFLTGNNGFGGRSLLKF